MNPSQQHYYTAERENDGVMLRTMTGIINFWNQGAERLYGWRKEEAVGRVSHDLLQTRFPKPLEEIESELARSGRWEGDLVHSTRDGSHVTVHSLWCLDRTMQPETVIEINAPSASKAKNNKLSSKAALFADAALVAGICGCLTAFFYSVYLYDVVGARSVVSFAGVVAYKVLPAITAVLLAAALRLPSVYRINLALLLCSAGFSFYGAELFVSLSASKYSGSETLWGDVRLNKSERNEIQALAKRFNVEFDTRSRLDVIRELRGQGIPALPSIAPSALLKEQAGGRIASEITIDGKETLPLGGISNAVSVLCNEAGRYSIYDSDERGFNNPRGIWGSKSMAIAAVGDSFTEGSCVPSERNFMALIRNQYADTLSLGMSGDGPLFMLAATKEYLPLVKPKTVLWFFYEGNDFVELWKESKTHLLRQYLGGNFNQGLFDRQAEIDRALLEYVERGMESELGRRKREEEKDGRDVSQSVLEFLKLSSLRGALGLVYGRAAQKSDDELYTQEQLELFRTILLQAKSTVEEWDGTLHFVYLPARDRYAKAADYHRQGVLNIVKDSGIPIIDIHARFQRESDPMSLFPFGRFGHYNEQGQRMVAEEVLRVISMKNPTVASPP